MYSKSLCLLMFLAGSYSAHARVAAGAGQATAQLKNPGSLYGLCSGDDQNKSGRWVSQGFCQDISDTLKTQKSCSIQSRTKMTAGKSGETLIESLRNDEKALKTMEASCPGLTAEMSHNPTKFNLFMTNII